MQSGAYVSSTHRIRQGEPGLPIPPYRIVAPTAMEQKFGRVGSLLNSVCKLTEYLCAISRALMSRPRCVLQTCNVGHTQSATSECVASKTRLDPIFCPWLVKYGRKSRFSLSNSVVLPQHPVPFSTQMSRLPIGQNEYSII